MGLYTTANTAPFAAPATGSPSVMACSTPKTTPVPAPTMIAVLAGWARRYATRRRRPAVHPLSSTPAASRVCRWASHRPVTPPWNERCPPTARVRSSSMDAVSWEEFEASDKGMAEHVRQRLTYAPCYLATVRPDGFPRVHPVGVHVRAGELVVPMNPTSPKGADIRRNGRFAL